MTIIAFLLPLRALHLLFKNIVQDTNELPAQGDAAIHEFRAFPPDAVHAQLHRRVSLLFFRRAFSPPGLHSIFACLVN